MTMGFYINKYSSPEVSLSIGSVIIWGDIGALELLSLLHFRRASVHCVVVYDAFADELQDTRAVMPRIRSFCYLMLAQRPFSACPSAGFPIAMDNFTLFPGCQARAGQASTLDFASRSFSKEKAQEVPTSARL